MSTALLTTPQHSKFADARSAGFDDLPRVVSATSLSAQAEVRAMHRPTVPNYALRRLIVGGLAAVAVVGGLLGVVGLSAGFTGAPASAASSAASEVETSPTVHVAQSGDTLWSIANAYRGEVDRDRFIDVLVRLNGDVRIQVGQAVWLP